ncbi:hypothetical protein V8E51_016602 [Hyaloscypha variabilis]
MGDNEASASPARARNEAASCSTSTPGFIFTPVTSRRTTFDTVDTNATESDSNRAHAGRKSNYHAKRGSRSRRHLTPEDYTKSICAHSRRSITSCIYPGQCYIDLAAWLQRPQSSYQDDHCLAVLYDLALEGPSRVRYLRSNDLQELNAHPRSEQDAGQVLLLRGYLSPAWVSLIGGKYQVDPEFFHRHLEFFVTLVSRGVYAYPSLPSTSTNIRKLCITTILYQERAKRTGPKADLQVRRIGESETMATYRRQYQTGGHCGDSIVREFESLDEEYSLLEQDISICIVKNGSGWLAIVWLDVGRDLTLGLSGPWTQSQGLSGRNREPFPIMQHHPKMTVRQTAVERAVEANNSQHPAVDYQSRATIPQSTALLPFELETFLDEKSTRNNAMYALSNIFRHAAFSEAQVLSVLERQIEHELGVMQPEDMRSHTLDNLQYFSSILTRHIRHIRNAVRALKSKDDEFSIGGDPAIISVTMDSLNLDFEDLLSRALDLYERCKDGMGVMQNRAIIVESRKAIEQSERVKKLTMLASFFVPLSFSTSVFGMNFREFGQGRLSVWLFAVVSIPIILVSLCFYLWDVWAWICVVCSGTRRFIMGIPKRRFQRQQRFFT